MKYKILKGTGGVIAIISFWLMFWNLKEIIWDKNYSHILRFTEGQVTNLELIFDCILILLWHSGKPINISLSLQVSNLYCV